MAEGTVGGTRKRRRIRRPIAAGLPAGRQVAAKVIVAGITLLGIPLRGRGWRGGLWQAIKGQGLVHRLQGVALVEVGLDRLWKVVTLTVLRRGPGVWGIALLVRDRRPAARWPARLAASVLILVCCRPARRRPWLSNVSRDMRGFPSTRCPLAPCESQLYRISTGACTPRIAEAPSPTPADWRG